MTQLQPGGIYPVWSSVAACGYPTPTSLDPNGMAAAVRPVSRTEPSCRTSRPAAAYRPGTRGTLGRILVRQQQHHPQHLYIPGGVYIAGPNINVTIENSKISTARRLGVRLRGRREREQRHRQRSSTTGFTTPTMATICSAEPGEFRVGNTTTRSTSDIDCSLLHRGGATAPADFEGHELGADHRRVVEPAYHTEPMYVWPGETADIENNTLVNPRARAAEIFGDSNAGGTLTNITVKNNLLAGNQDNGGVLVGCTAGNGFQADFGHYPEHRDRRVRATGSRTSTT